jgi:hypothetical protein
MQIAFEQTIFSLTKQIPESYWILLGFRPRPVRGHKN